jgi:hypothetical protein
VKVILDTTDAKGIYERFREIETSPSSFFKIVISFLNEHPELYQEDMHRIVVESLIQYRRETSYDNPARSLDALRALLM